MKRCIYIVFALCTTLVGYLVSAKDVYVASGTFYYWFHGMEMTAGFGAWGGPDPLYCFREDIWDRRPRDFDWKVWNQMQRVYRQPKGTERQVAEALSTVTFGRDMTSFTWKKIYVTSPDPVLAGHVANACMEVLSNIEIELREEQNQRMKERTALVFYRLTCQRERLHESATNELAKIDKGLSRCRSEIEMLQHVDVRTNTMFKIMVRAGGATNKLDLATSKRLEGCRRYWDGLPHQLGDGL